MARLIGSSRRRGTFLSLFGPLSILALVGLWAVGLIFGFALLHWSLATPLNGTGNEIDIGEYFYFSGVTFFTLGFGDVTPSEPVGRFLAVSETGIGFGFLAVVISYLPVLYQAFCAVRSRSACSTPAPARRQQRPRSWLATAFMAT